MLDIPFCLRQLSVFEYYLNNMEDLNNTKQQESQNKYCYYTRLVCVETITYAYRANISYGEMHLLSVMGAGMYAVEGVSSNYHS